MRSKTIAHDQQSTWQAQKKHTVSATSKWSRNVWIIDMELVRTRFREHDIHNFSVTHTLEEYHTHFVIHPCWATLLNLISFSNELFALLHCGRQ
jgi:hypothetical protein